MALSMPQALSQGVMAQPWTAAIARRADARAHPTIPAARTRREFSISTARLCDRAERIGLPRTHLAAGALLARWRMRTRWGRHVCSRVASANPAQAPGTVDPSPGAPEPRKLLSEGQAVALLNLLALLYGTNTRSARWSAPVFAVHAAAEQPSF